MMEVDYVESKCSPGRMGSGAVCGGGRTISSWTVRCDNRSWNAAWRSELGVLPVWRPQSRWYFGCESATRLCGKWLAIVTSLRSRCASGSGPGILKEIRLDPPRSAQPQSRESCPCLRAGRIDCTGQVKRSKSR